MCDIVCTIHSVASAPTNVMAVQDGPTGIRVSWTPPTPLGDTTGYRISYTGGSSGSVDVSGGSTDEYTLTGLQSGTTYTISIVGTSQDQPSSAVVLELTLSERDKEEEHVYTFTIIHIMPQSHLQTSLQ